MTEVNKINMLGKINQIDTAPANGALRRGDAASANFKTLLDEQLSKNSPLVFSKHAQIRACQRGIELTDALLENLSSAVTKARDKGARDVVVIDARQAFIVNVANNMVITTMAGSEMKENVFTNIDSAVII